MTKNQLKSKSKMSKKTPLRNVIKAEFDEEFDVDFDNEIFTIEPIEIEIIENKRMAKGFAILCYNVRSIFSKDYNDVTYELYYGDKAKGNKIISKEEAMTLIDIHEMELVVNNIYGKVWE